MPSLRPTNPLIRRLRWLMLCVILVDITNTLLGQPESFWKNPASAIERNELVRLVLTRGWGSFAIGTLCYLAVTFLAASLLPARLALIVELAVILGHYFGASTWWVYRWQFGVKAPVVYGIVLAIALVGCGVGRNDPNSGIPASTASAKD